MLVLTHLYFYSHIPPLPIPELFERWGRSAKTTVALVEKRGCRSLLKPEEGGAGAHAWLTPSFLSKASGVTSARTPWNAEPGLLHHSVAG